MPIPHRTSFLAVLFLLAVVVPSSGAAAGGAPAETAAPIVPFLSGAPACLATAKSGNFDPRPLSCDASATCYDSSVITCHESGSGTCQGVDANCPNLPGYVTCGGTRTNCPSCPTCEIGPCTVPCGVASDCYEACCGPAACVNGGCNPSSKKYCVCA